ncbi:phosphatidylinositol-specific phospholipase C1-like protein [Fodinibius salsisoli]|uniref:Phosphatidylinositol-specific phospholipase C1-like protein n=1 Tax=Fodinibius salsisoli TaxID=2820877 RepID=A0ABT3PKJ8_9BACT|nr:phosphatidylinositol-specific phospholipase C1-like protein [Fodinibius salsisoli]MCW9706439.1 phosphatidylinositol-specific phospholipase C1-like protein [Fodinibius salsisoli]
MFRLLPFFCSLLLLASIFVGTTAAQQTASPKCEDITKANVDDCLRLNQIQLLGTHNSYHQAPTAETVALFNGKRPGWAKNLQYTHHPLKEQLERLGIRQFELDIFADPQGGLFAEPLGAIQTGDKAYLRKEEMMRPGFKVLHVPDVDYRSQCLTLTACLSEINDWSSGHPNHLPIMVLLEVKDKGVAGQFSSGNHSFVKPVPVNASNIKEIDKEIWQAFSSDQVMTPDEVRGRFASLEEAILTEGWPTLAESRGKVLFALDNTGKVKKAYLADRPNLEGGALFVSSEPGHPTAGFIKMNDVLSDRQSIKERAAAGYIIRTRADIPLEEARTGDTTRRDAALQSGAQFISTDFPEVSSFGSDYKVTLPGATGSGRCNPVSAPKDCRHHFITE